MHLPETRCSHNQLPIGARASSVWEIPNLANRLLQVGLLSSMASSPLLLATSVLAVSISRLRIHLGIAPFPVPDFRHFPAELIDVVPVLDKLVLHQLL